jgi:nicotinamidase-related amidase
MAHLPSYPREHTALLLIDPYNDFLAEGGKFWPQLAEIATQVHLHDNLRTLARTAREQHLPVFIVPHHRSEPSDLDGWDHPTPYQIGASKLQLFAKGTWGGEWHPDFVPQPGDVVCKEHLNSSGFANTDLDFLLRQRRITHVILVGLIANTCIETTGKFATELGYHVTLVRDATAATSREALHSAHHINGPTFAHALVTTAELVTTLRN